MFEKICKQRLTAKEGQKRWYDRRNRDRKTYGQVTATPEELQNPRSYLVESEGAVYRRNRQHLVPTQVHASDQKRPSRRKQNFNLGIGENHRLLSSLDNADADLDVPAVNRDSGGSEVDEPEWRGWPGRPTENKNLTNLRRSSRKMLPPTWMGDY
ncbi:hypothetical protein PR048_003732, partial [Dryococelus australis]